MQAYSPQVILEKFAQHYKTCNNEALSPPMIRMREFGFLLLKERAMLRHKSFQTSEDLKSFLLSAVPSDAYYSTALYEQPEADMDRKNWLGADLVFDIDADHIRTPCGKIHDRWTCSSCGFTGKGPSPDACPTCGGGKFDKKVWTCDICLASAKQETIKLVDMLVEDFGFADKDIRVYFSGNRGYHVHVEDRNVQLLDSMARKEIVDYIIGLGFRADMHKLMDKGKVLVRPESTGWRGRIAKGLDQLLSKMTLHELEAIGLKRKQGKLLIDNRKKLLDGLHSDGWFGVRGVGIANWKRIFEWVVDQQSAKIDTVVTTDIHRLIRLPRSLHGKTGFMKVEAPSTALEGFDPLKKAVAFREGQLAVDITEAPEFRVGEEHYGPFKNTHTELPTAVAVFLVCKGAARMVK